MLAAGDYLAPPFKRWLSRLFLPEASWNRADQDAAAAEIAAHLDVLEGAARRAASIWPAAAFTPGRHRLCADGLRAGDLPARHAARAASGGAGLGRAPAGASRGA